MSRIPEPFKNIAAVVISYNPGNDLVENVQAVLLQVDKVIVVDNGSDSQLELVTLSELPGVDVIRNQANEGIAQALNQGVERAITNGYEYVLTLDQDSRPAPGMVEKLLDVYETHPRAKRIAMVGPSVDDPVADIRGRYLRQRGHLSFELVPCMDGWIENVTFIITSGALCRTDVYWEIGPFWSELFIDYVDLDYSLSARRAGYEIVVNCNARLIHRLGKRQKRVIMGRTEYPRFHSPVRWYYSSRNRISLLKKYSWTFPYWFMYEVLNFGYGFIRMLILEDQRLEKTLSFFRGTWDGLRGRFGPA